MPFITKMRSLLFSLFLPLALCADEVSEKVEWSVTKLPRPNSGEFTDAQAEARKAEILANVPTPQLNTWKNPTMGFCVHIDKDDKVIVYGHSAPFVEHGRVFPSLISVAEMKALVPHLPLDSSPASILITSARSLRQSKAIHEVLDALFKPSVQLFYARPK